MFHVPDSYIESLVGEDLYILDVTTDAVGIEDMKGAVECLPERECVVAGVEESARIFNQFLLN